MMWAVLLLQDTKTLQTYETYARESAYEAEGERPPHTNTNDRRPRNQETQPKRCWTAQHPVHEQARTSSGATGMDVDSNPAEQGTPPGTPFDEDFIPSTTRG